MKKMKGDEEQDTVWWVGLGMIQMCTHWVMDVWRREKKGRYGRRRDEERH